ncbi:MULTISPECIES: beta strand repeat-containing protein [Sphingomonas]|uniref:beta strand repeat-containing protein n=1 Tax=Sphingomonas TaxID=13687 RepID=UPI00082DA0F7|nr:Calx-beta domain-containing protein [Sphingomonas sp. CCH10-B3]
MNYLGRTGRIAALDVDAGSLADHRANLFLDANYFAMLEAGKSPPVADAAGLVGVPSPESQTGGAIASDIINVGPTPQDTVRFLLSSGNFTQNWSSALVVNDDWSSVPSIVGYRGDGLAGGTAVDPRTITGNVASPIVDLNVFQTNPNTFTTGGVTYFSGAMVGGDGVVALAGSGTARAPHLQFYLDSTGRQDITVSYRLRDLETGSDNAAQQVALQYRTSSTGTWSNVTGGYTADATAGPNTAGPDINVSVTLPADANNQSQLELRIITTDAASNDEWVGIDDIVVSSSPGATTVTVNDVSVTEGNAGTSLLTFTITRSDNVGAFTLNYATADATATAGSDYVAANGTATFTAGGALTQTVSVTINGDTAPEANETFQLNLTNLASTIGTASITDAQGIGTITNDDTAPLPNLTINDVTAAEGNSGTTTFTFTVSLSAPAPAGGVTFDIATADGTATGGSDFVARTLTSQTILAGASTYTFDVTVNGDTTFEPNETFVVNVTNVTGATVSDGQGQGTITNDDTAPAPTLVSSTPADNATGVAIGANIVLTFDQNVQAGTGDIILRPATGSDITIPVANAQVTFSGSTVTINPTADLRPGVAYDVIIGSGVITNSGGTAFAGIALDALDFTSSFSIPDGTFNAVFAIADPGTFTLQSGTTRNASGSNGVLVAAATGPVNVTIDGTLNFTSPGQRAINYGNVPFNGTISVGASGVVQSLNGDAIRSQSARGQIDLTNLGQIIARSVAFTPSVGGTNPGTAFAITYNAALGANGALPTDFTSGGRIVNGSFGNSAALIRSDNGDAIRLGSHQTLINYGTINGNGPINDAATNNVFNGANGNPNTSTTQTYDVSRGVRINQAAATAVTISNFGTITGAQHGVDVGVTDATGIIIQNGASGQIIGRNGSGIGADTIVAGGTNFRIVNDGLIRGSSAPAFDRAGYVSVDGDGDGIDVDGGASITNNASGVIESTGATGFDSNGRANNSEAISIGGGSVTNQGRIEGANFGIVVNNDSNADNSRSGNTQTTIRNFAGGMITGTTGFAIRLENKTGTAIDNDSITNYGAIIGNGNVPTGTVLRQDNIADPGTVGTLDGVTYTVADAGNARFIRGDGAAIQMGEGNDTLVNYGNITGNSGRAINLEGGNDQLTWRTGSSVAGRIDGGAGTDTLILALDDRTNGNAQTGNNSGVTVGLVREVINFESLTVTSGTWTLGDSQAYSGGVALNGGRLNLGLVVTGAITFGAGAQTLGIANGALGTDPARTLGNAIIGFGADGDVLDFTGIAAGTVITSYDATTGLLKLIDSGDTAQATINVGTGLGAFAFSLTNNGSGGTAVSLVANAGGNTGFGGSGGNDNYTGTAGNDFFNFSQGGNDRVNGGDGNDGFLFGAAFTAGDSVDGGNGTNDQIGLQGNYAGANALTLSANTIANVEVIAVLPGFSYDITTVDANIAAGQTLTLFGTNLGAGDNFTVNASAETDGAVRVYGGLGIDTFTGGAGNDGFYFGPGRFNPATDTVNGGAGANDQLALDGNYTGTLTGAQISNVEVLALLAGVAGDFATYNIQFADSLVGAGQNFTVFALPVVTALQLDASAETNGNYSFTAGSVADTVIGGAGNDTFFGGTGADVLTGGAGNDLFRYTAINETLLGGADRITDFAVGDRIELTQIDADGNAGNGDTAFAFIGAGAFTNVAGQLHVIASGADWLVEGDVNGDGVADFQIVVQGAQPLEAQFAL